jgi:hypothetical protein
LKLVWRAIRQWQLTNTSGAAIIANNLQTVEPDFLLEVETVALAMGETAVFMWP